MQYFTKAWQIVIIGKGIGLEPNTWQAIPWTNEDLVYWCIYVSSGPSELTDHYCDKKVLLAAFWYYL